MKLSILSLGLPILSSFALAAPTTIPIGGLIDRSIARRAAVADVATTGYATQNGGTTGGKGGATVSVSTYDQLAAAVAGDTPKIVMITKSISKTAKQIKVGSNKSVIGKSSAVKLTGFGLLIKDEKNVILRNFAVSKVTADNGDAIAVQKSTNVWIDHLDLSSAMVADKDFYDGLLDCNHATDFVTISNTKLHDHWKASLVGHSDSNAGEDKGHLRITYHNNYFYNINSRGPSFRFGTGHIYNNLFDKVSDGINTRQGAQLLVQNNVFIGSKKPLFSTDGGYAVASGNDFGGAKNMAPAGSLKTVPYKTTLLGTGEVKAAVSSKAGNTLKF